MEEKTNLPAVWPTKFEGSDLLPLVPAETEEAQDLVGQENVELEDLILPTLRLLQGLSDEVTEGVEDAKPGRFVLSTTGDILEPPIRVLFVHHSKSRALFPKPGMPSDVSTCVSRDGVTGTQYGACEGCGYSEWGQNNEPPLCAASQNFVCMTPYGPAVLRFAKTSFKAARGFITTWTLSRKNLFMHPAVISAKPRTKDVGGKQVTYFVMDIKWDQRETVPPELQAAARALWEQVQAHHEQGKFSSDTEEMDLPDGL